MYVALVVAVCKDDHQWRCFMTNYEMQNENILRAWKQKSQTILCSYISLVDFHYKVINFLGFIMYRIKEKIKQMELEISRLVNINEMFDES